MVLNYIRAMFSYVFYRHRGSSPTRVHFRWGDIRWVRHEFGDLYFRISIDGLGDYYVRGEFDQMEASYLGWCRGDSFKRIGNLIGMVRYS